MWIILAFTSACLLGFYDVFKKKSLAGNAVLPVLMVNTVVCAAFFLPFILMSFCGNTQYGNHPKPTVLYVPQYVANFVSKKSCSI